MRKKQHRENKKKELKNKKNFYQQNDDRPDWANDDKIEEFDINWKKNFINEVKAVHLKNKQEGENLMKSKSTTNQSVDNLEMQRGLAGLAAYHNMGTIHPVQKEKISNDSKVIVLDSTSNQVQSGDEKLTVK